MKHMDVDLHSTSYFPASIDPGSTFAMRAANSRRVQLLPIHRLLVIGLILVYAIILILTLKWIISTAFANQAYGYFPLQQADLFLWTWGAAILPAMFLPIQAQKPSQFLVWILMLIVYIPGVLIPPYALGYCHEYAPYQSVMLGCMLILCGTHILPAVRIPSVRWSLRAYVLGLLVYSALTMGWIVSQVGIPTSIPSFADVYVVRAAYGDSVSAPGPLAYLIAWQTSVINPLLLLIGLVRRKWLLVAIGIGLNLLMYSLAGHKSHLLSSVLVVSVYILLGIASQWRAILLAAGAMVIVIVSSMLHWLSDFIYPVSIFVRRMIIVPGMLTGYYYDYFSDFGPTRNFFPLSILLKRVEMELTTPNTIGLEYFGNPKTAANANFWADGFSAFGFPGMVLATLFLVVVLWTMNSLVTTRPARIATPLFVVAMFSLTNSALPTSLITHGILFTMLMILLLPAFRSELEESHSQPGRHIGSNQSVAK